MQAQTCFLLGCLNEWNISLALEQITWRASTHLMKDVTKGWCNTLESEPKISCVSAVGKLQPHLLAEMLQGTSLMSRQSLEVVCEAERSLWLLML